MAVLVIFLVAMTTHLTKATYRKERFIWAHAWRVQSTVAGKAWQEEREAAGHTMSAVRKQGQMNAGTLMTISLFSGGPQPMR